jgi:hypothetical protein
MADILSSFVNGRAKCTVRLAFCTDQAPASLRAAYTMIAITSDFAD